jgi:hypothetical protein
MRHLAYECVIPTFFGRAALASFIKLGFASRKVATEYEEKNIIFHPILGSDN